jgi:hypothetical protein
VLLDLCWISRSRLFPQLLLRSFPLPPSLCRRHLPLSLCFLSLSPCRLCLFSPSLHLVFSLPSRCLHGVGNSRKSTSPRRCWTGASRAGICLPRDEHAAPGCPEAPSRRLHPGVLPPLPAHLGSSSSPVGCWKFEKIDLPPTMLDRGFQSRHLLTQRRACCPGLPRGPEQAPAPWSPPSAACAPPTSSSPVGLC